MYFERLCLDCRVDKSNRRLSFAACLLLSIKNNEAHVGLVMRNEEDGDKEESSDRVISKKGIKSLIRPTKKSSTMFASILEFFTQEWSISLKHLYAAVCLHYQCLHQTILSKVTFALQVMVPALYVLTQTGMAGVCRLAVPPSCNSFTGCFPFQTMYEGPRLERKDLFGNRNV